LITGDANIRCTVSLDHVRIGALVLPVVCGDSNELWQWYFERSLFIAGMLLGICYDRLAR
jgi:hypothetical protein